MVNVGTISASLEDYLETIFDLVKEFGTARISAVAKRKSVRKASANEAVNRLSEEGLVSHDRYSDISLTREGSALARTLSKRHAVIKRFLEEIIAVSPKIADEDACTIEHHVHPETVKGLVRFFEFLDSCPNGGPTKGDLK